MKLKSQRDFWSGLMLVLVGLAFAWSATADDFGSSARPGPGMLPFGLGLLLALLGGLTLFKSLAIESERGEPVSQIAWRPVLLVPVAICAFGYGMPRLGLVCTVAVVTVLAVLATGEQRWRWVLLAAALAPVLAWAVLIQGLHLALPVWPGMAF